MTMMVAYGGGVNSTAMLIGMYRRQLRPDLILFADTGGERPETYQFVEEFGLWLKEHGFPEIITVRAPNVTLEQRCLDHKALPSVAYGFKSCSQRFKLEPQEKFVNNWQAAKDAWARGERVVKAIGYDAWEHHRAKLSGDAKYTCIYPLVEWDWNRDDCERVCHEEDLSPSKSSCFFCPNSKPYEIKKLAREHPCLADRAVAMEHNAELTTIKGLGRRWSWESLIKADRDQSNLFEDTTQDMPCGCYDG